MMVYRYRNHRSRAKSCTTFIERSDLFRVLARTRCLSEAPTPGRTNISGRVPLIVVNIMTVPCVTLADYAAEHAAGTSDVKCLQTTLNRSCKMRL